MKSQVAFGLDMGTSKVACVAAVKDERGRLSILGASQVACDGLRKGLVADEDAVAGAVDRAVRHVSQSAGVDPTSVVVGLGGQLVVGLNSQGFIPVIPPGRKLAREDVLQVINHSRQIVMPPDRELIQAIPKEFRIDGERGIRSPIGMPANRLEVVTYLLTVASSQLHVVEELLGRLGLSIRQVLHSALASGLSVVTAQEIEQGVAVVDIGSGMSEVSVFAHGSIAYTGTVPIGSKSITSDVAKLIKTELEEAERLKLEYGCAIANLVESLSADERRVQVMQLGQTQARPMDRKVLCEIIESRAREISMLVRQELERSGMADRLGAGIVLTGGGSQLPAIDKLFGAVLGKAPVRCGIPVVHGPAATAAARPEMAAAVGLAEFVLEEPDDEFAPATGVSGWKDKIRTLWSLLSGRS